MTSAKKNAEKSIVNTIDEKHTELLNHFYQVDTEILPKLISDKKRLKRRLLKIPENNVDLKMEIQDRICVLSEKIAKLKPQRTNYLLDNSKYIFQYFEEKKKISSGTNNQNANVVNNFFKIKAKTPESSDINNDKYQTSKKTLQLYWANVNGEIFNVQDFVIPSDICEYCHNGELIPQDEEGILICNNFKCGKFITHIVDSAKPTNKEPPNEVSYTAYIRLNHFKEILSQFQAKETTQIPDEIIEQIRNRIKKDRITDMSLINYDKMRDILRKLRLNKYFEHIQYINSIFGIKPPIMNEELHETLCVLFIEIQKPWAVHCPANRSNFFNYTYTLYQLCMLLDQTQYLPYIPMMKDRDKQLEQDMIWRKVCNDLDWEFFPTV
jgi:hypothetical protein